MINHSDLRRAQLIMLSMLEVVDAICQKHQFEYWLDAGTLLGAIRHQGFIPWDDDMDIAMPRESYEAFLRIAPQEIPSSMWLQTAKTDPGYFNLAAPLKIRDRNSRFIEKHERGDETYVQGVFIDVFVYDRMPENIKHRQRYKFLSRKIIRLLSTKYSKIPMCHHASLYKAVGKLFQTATLENYLQQMVQSSNTSNSPYFGRGYHCIGNNLLTRDDIYPLQRARFETGQFNIINQPEKLLIQQYNEDYLTLPPLHQREMRHCKELSFLD